MKKRIGVALILIVVTMSFFMTKVTNGTEKVFEFGKDESLTEIQGGTEADNFNKLQESGTVSTNGETRQENVPTQVSSNSLNIINRILLLYSKYFLISFACSIPFSVNELLILPHKQLLEFSIVSPISTNPFFNSSKLKSFIFFIILSFTN